MTTGNPTQIERNKSPEIKVKERVSHFGQIIFGTFPGAILLVYHKFLWSEYGEQRCSWVAGDVGTPFLHLRYCCDG